MYVASENILRHVLVFFVRKSNILILKNKIYSAFVIYVKRI